MASCVLYSQGSLKLLQSSCQPISCLILVRKRMSSDKVTRELLFWNPQGSNQAAQNEEGSWLGMAALLWQNSISYFSDVKGEKWLALICQKTETESPRTTVGLHYFISLQETWWLSLIFRFPPKQAHWKRIRGSYPPQVFLPKNGS